tara:strand:- start:8408 stop:8680 length:273 start_codon:yes stop_codon:yes gene_type:complete
MRKSPSSIVSRTGAAIVGGYVLANCMAFALAAALPLHQIDATLMAMQLTYLFYAVAAIWAFAANRARTAWLGLVAPSGIALLIWALLRFV